MPEKSTIVIVCGTVGLFGVIGVGAYFNDKRQHEPFPADVYVGREIALARSMAGDAEVVALVADYVDEAGLVHSSFDQGRYYAPGGHLAMAFHSASHASGAPPSSGMLGAPSTGAPPARCPSLDVSARLRGNKSRSLTIEGNWRDGDCRASFPEPIRCTVATVWQRAIAAGAPHPALADIELGPAKSGAGRAWRFSITDRATQKEVFTKSFADDC
jgi:hypothetical protein